MTPAKEIDGELWIRADDHHRAVGEIEAEWQRRCDDVKQEANYWHKRHDAVIDAVVKSTLLLANPPITMMADKESYELGKLHGAAAERKSKPHSLGPGEMELSLRREHDGELFELRHRFTAEQTFHGNDYMVEEAAQAMDEMLDERIAAAIRARGQA